MINSAPPGSLGLATPSGWMNSQLFVEVMRHFIRHTNSSIENPTFLLFDNHESHLSLECIDLAKSSGVTILTFPPHCTNKLQPLDVGVYFSFKAHYNRAVDSWLMHHPGIPMTIYDIPQCVTSAFQQSMTPINIISGFRKSGIFPFNRDVFTQDDFLPSSVTDRPTSDSRLDCSNQNIVTGEQNTLNHDVIEMPPSTSSLATNYAESSADKTKLAPSTKKIFLSPQEFRGFPKAAPRKNTLQNRRRGKSFIPTDTPEKLELEAKNLEKRKVKAKLVKRKLVESESSDSNDDGVDFSDKSSDYEENIDVPITGFEELDRNADIDDYVLVKFPGKKSIKYFIGKILSERNKYLEYNISYLRRKEKCNKFYYPNVPEIATVISSGIVMILPNPQLFGKTKRQNNYVQFEVNFGNLEIQ